MFLGEVLLQGLLDPPARALVRLEVRRRDGGVAFEQRVAHVDRSDQHLSRDRQQKPFALGELGLRRGRARLDVVETPVGVPHEAGGQHEQQQKAGDERPANAQARRSERVRRTRQHAVPCYAKKKPRPSARRTGAV
jgi:hypothetical protein